MFKKVFCILLSALFCFCLTSCKPKTVDVPQDSSGDNAVDSGAAQSLTVVNPLTGLDGLSKEKLNLRPVAIMVDNDSSAQKNTQSGVSSADIVYETETEGGITRLMCVYKDIEGVKQIGDIRSVRYAYVDLALAHNAILVHCGKDKVFCGPHLSDIDNFEIGTDYYGYRKQLGSAFGWQTLFTSGETLLKGFKEKNWETTTTKTDNWVNFADQQTTVTLSGGAANQVSAPFNSSYISNFTFDTEKGCYIKTSAFAKNKDKNNSNAYEFENVFILQTKMSYYDSPKNYRRKIDLTGGKGYYVTNGTYEKITWKKGTDADEFVFTKEDGSPLTVSPGNSWVCIIKDSEKPTFK